MTVSSTARLMATRLGHALAAWRRAAVSKAAGAQLAATAVAHMRRYRMAEAARRWVATATVGRR